MLLTYNSDAGTLSLVSKLDIPQEKAAGTIRSVPLGPSRVEVVGSRISVGMEFVCRVHVYCLGGLCTVKRCGTCVQ